MRGNQRILLFNDTGYIGLHRLSITDQYGYKEYKEYEKPFKKFL